MYNEKDGFLPYTEETRNKIMSKIILTGDRPTGRLHVGHYVGSLRRRVELQNSGEFDKIFIMIAMRGTDRQRRKSGKSPPEYH